MQTEAAERSQDPRSERPRIRTASNSDRDQVVLLHEEGLSDHGARHDPNLDSDLEDLEGFYRSPGGEFLVQYSGDRLVAMGGFRKLDSKSVELRQLRVTKSWRGKGLGRAMIQALVARAKELGFKQMVLDASEDMLDVRMLLESEGFELDRKGEFFGINLYFYRIVL
jgi:GNAT superfamily N-acetyltransferase